MKNADVTGLSIALVDDQRVVWAQGFGYADKAANIKATADTTYHLGSIAKVFTATAAMQLAEQGKLDIDQPIQKYLPEFSIKSRYRRYARHHAAQHHDAPFRPARLLGARHERAPSGAIRGSGHSGTR